MTTMKLMKLQLQGPLISPSTSKALGDALAMCTLIKYFLKSVKTKCFNFSSRLIYKHCLFECDFPGISSPFVGAVEEPRTYKQTFPETSIDLSEFLLASGPQNILGSSGLPRSALPYSPGNSVCTARG